jgi:hypothetical protein
MVGGPVSRLAVTAVTSGFGGGQLIGPAVAGPACAEAVGAGVLTPGCPARLPAVIGLPGEAVPGPLCRGGTVG